MGGKTARYSSLNSYIFVRPKCEFGKVINLNFIEGKVVYRGYEDKGSSSNLFNV